VNAPDGIHVEAAGDGPALVLVHAGICDSGMWDPQWRTLAGGHRLIRHDMRGFGRSPAPPGAYWIDGPGRRPEDVDPELRRHAHAMQLRALELQVPSYLEVGDLEEPLVPDLGERLGEVTRPTLVVIGEADQPDIHAIARRIVVSLPDTTEASIPDAGHLPSMERPEAFDRILEDFLSRPA